MKPRALLSAGRVWFPVVDLNPFAVRPDESSLQSAVSRWVTKNVPASDVALKRVRARSPQPNRPGTRRPLVRCVALESVPVVKMYLAHRQAGGTFIARWAALPDSTAAQGTA